jgi:high-affinity K+ transport system ATPase subunit B
VNADREQAMDRWIEAVAESHRRKVAADAALTVYLQSLTTVRDMERALIDLLEVQS